MLRGLRDAGYEIGVLAKYGFATDALFDGAEQLSDGKAYLKHSSFGATAANFGETLPEAYLAEAAAKGTSKYVSPDRMVDASTCLFPDSTWIVGAIQHQDSPGFLNAFAYRFLSAETPMTVESDPAFPQFLLNDNGALTPMTEENQSQSLARPERRGFWPALKEFFVQLFRYLKAWFAELSANR